MSQSVDLVVKQGASRIEAIQSRPIRLLPDKSTADVVYSQAVYPLRLDDDGGHYIDIQDRSYDKQHCEFVSA